ncbi:hypothetical protein NEPAR05_1030 [Nematocida parisii]|nr:hypothetical protein NEPAR05_1030 [Nematocida parisii]
MKLDNYTIKVIIGISCIAVGLLCIFIPVVITIINIKSGYEQVVTVEMSDNPSNHNLLHREQEVPLFYTHSTINNPDGPLYNNTVIESDESGPSALHNRKDNLLVIFIRTFNTNHNKLLLVLGLMIVMFGSLILLSNKRKEERFFCGTITNDTLINKLRNNEHSVISYDQSYLPPQAVQMPKPDEFSTDPFEIPRASYDYKEYSHGHRPKRGTAQQNPTKPEKSCITRSEWDEIVEAHDKKYADAGISIGLATPDNLCSIYE